MEEDQLLRCCVCSSRVKDPILLSCLHSCCSDCLQAVTTDGVDAQCPVCKESMTSGDAGFAANSFVSALVQQPAKDCGGHLCDACKDGDGSQRLARHFCTDCSMSLCDNCLAWHDKFNDKLDGKQHTIIVRQRPQSNSELAGCVSDEPLRSIHNEACVFFCFACSRPKGSTSVAQCLAAQHDVGELQSNRVADRLMKAESDISALLLLLEGKLATARNCCRATAGLLRDREDEAVALVTSVHESAEKAVSDRYAEYLLDEGLSKLPGGAAPLAAGLGHAIAYGRALVDSGDKISLLDQYSSVLSCASSLAVEADKLPRHQRMFGVVRSKQDRRHLDQALQTFIGLPGAGKLQGDGLSYIAARHAVAKQQGPQKVRDLQDAARDDALELTDRSLPVGDTGDVVRQIVSLGEVSRFSKADEDSRDGVIT